MQPVSWLLNQQTKISPFKKREGLTEGIKTHTQTELPPTSVIATKMLLEIKIYLLFVYFLLQKAQFIDPWTMTTLQDTLAFWVDTWQLQLRASHLKYVRYYPTHFQSKEQLCTATMNKSSLDLCRFARWGRENNLWIEIIWKICATTAVRVNFQPVCGFESQNISVSWTRDFAKEGLSNLFFQSWKFVASHTVCQPVNRQSGGILEHISL